MLQSRERGSNRRVWTSAHSAGLYWGAAFVGSARLSYCAGFGIPGSRDWGELGRLDVVLNVGAALVTLVAGCGASGR